LGRISRDEGENSREINMTEKNQGTLGIGLLKKCVIG